VVAPLAVGAECTALSLMHGCEAGFDIVAQFSVELRGGAVVDRNIHCFFHFYTTTEVRFQRTNSRAFLTAIFASKDFLLLWCWFMLGWFRRLFRGSGAHGCIIECQIWKRYISQPPTNIELSRDCVRV
jgi:hypothetical protein